MLIHFYDFNFLMRCLLPRTSTHKYCIYPRITELALHCKFLSVPYFLSSLTIAHMDLNKNTEYFRLSTI